MRTKTALKRGDPDSQTDMTAPKVLTDWMPLDNLNKFANFQNFFFFKFQFKIAQNREHGNLVRVRDI